MSQIINTWDQNVAAGGDRIIVSYRKAEKWTTGGWHVIRIKDGKQLVTDKTAHWQDRGSKFFAGASREAKQQALELAFEWIHATYGMREFVRNRMGDFVEREVNEQFPLPRRTA